MQFVLNIGTLCYLMSQKRLTGNDSILNKKEYIHLLNSIFNKLAHLVTCTSVMDSYQLLDTSVVYEEMTRMFKSMPLSRLCEHWYWPHIVRLRKTARASAFWKRAKILGADRNAHWPFYWSCDGMSTPNNDRMKRATIEQDTRARNLGMW